MENSVVCSSEQAETKGPVHIHGMLIIQEKLFWYKRYCEVLLSPVKVTN